MPARTLGVPRRAGFIAAAAGPRSGGCAGLSLPRRWQLLLQPDPRGAAAANRLRAAPPAPPRGTASLRTLVFTPANC